MGTLAPTVTGDYIWVFERHGERCEIRRAGQPEHDAVLTVTRGGAVESYAFRDVSALILFQGELEALLLAAGWSFLGFSPDRRNGQRPPARHRTSERRRPWVPDAPLPR
jgi:hypothetical protein